MCNYTWQTLESADYIEVVNSVVNHDLHKNLDLVQTNCSEIIKVVMSGNCSYLLSKHKYYQSFNHIKSLV